MKWSIKLCSLLCSVLLCLICLPPRPAKVKAIHHVWMEVATRKVGMKATYKFHFSIEKTVKVHDWIKLYFPKEATLPPLPEKKEPPPPKDPGEIPPPRPPGPGFGNCDDCVGLPIIDYEENSMKFNSHIELDPSKEGYRDITVTVPEVAGIKNPTKPGFYTCKISTQPEPTPVESTPFEIVESRIGVPEGMPEVRLSNSSPGINSSYNIFFNVGRGGWLKAEDGRIRLKFPEGTVFSNPDIPSATLLINGIPVNAKPSISKLQLTLNTPVEIKNSGRVDIEILESAGVINPSLPGNYRIEVSTMPADPDWTPSSNYRIQEGGPILQIDPTEVSQIAEYSFSFLSVAESKITSTNPVMVMFPDGSGIPFELDPTNILINKKAVQQVTIKGKELYLFPAFPINSADIVEIKFKKEAGIKNPLIPGEIRLAYKLKNDPEYLYTQPVILEKTREELETTLLFIGGTLGKNGWFVQEPSIELNCSNPDANIFYYWNNQENRKTRYNGKPISSYPNPDFSPGYPAPPNPGQIVSKLTYWSEMKGGIDSKKDMLIKIDYVNPELIVFSPSETRVDTKDNIFLIKGRTTVIKTVGYDGDYLAYDKIVFVNNLPVSVSEINGEFSHEISLMQGENKIVVRAEDEAGRFVEKEFFINSDTIPPNLTVFYPVQNSTISSKKILIRGTCDDPTALVQVNGEIVDITENGEFSHELILDKVGKTNIVLEATDPIGNSTKKELMFWFGYTIVLKIGDKTGTTNEVVQNLNVAPLIQQGRTLVPFRFIGEQLNAKIDFTTNPLTKQVETVSYALDSVEIVLTIGKSQALVNGKGVALEVPPQIISGSTVVPLRFVTEGLGCLLTWEAVTQTITIQYPK